MKYSTLIDAPEEEYMVLKTVLTNCPQHPMNIIK